MKTAITLLLAVLLLIILTAVTGEQQLDNNPHPNWCPNAWCNIDHLCEPCKRRYLFIISQGRSGSTTMKNMLNFLPGVRIRGEMGLSIKRILQVFSEDETLNLQGESPDFRASFGHHKYRVNHMTCPVQTLMEAINPPESDTFNDEMTIIGFKEIRIHSMKEIDFLLKHFPCSRFIFNIRSTGLEESQNKHFKNPRFTMARNILIPSLYKELEKKLGPKQLIKMDMSDWSKTNGNHFTILASWLGFKDCVYTSLVHDNIYGYIGNQETLHLGDKCRLEL